MDKLTHMAVFAAVVEEGSFTAAGNRLGQSKSAVSKQIARLEDRLGARLLNRTTRRLSLTEEGRAFYERVRRIVEDAEAAESAVADLREKPRGRLRLTAPTSFGIRHLAPALPVFMGRCPEVTVDVTLSDRYVDIVDEGYDLAIRIGALADTSLIARRLAETRRPVVASPAYWDEHGRPSTPRNLAAHAALLYAYQGTPGQWTFRGAGRPETVVMTPRMLSNNGEILKEAAIAGVGVAALPTFLVGEALADGRLESVLEDREDVRLGVSAVYPAGRHLSVKIRAFVDFLVEHFGSSGWDPDA